jgi:hypothetical protein
MKRLALIAIALAACTSNDAPDAQTQAAFFHEMSTMQTVQSHALAQQSSFAPLTGLAGSVNATANCPISGTIALVGNYDSPDSGASATYDLHDTMTGCTGLDFTIDGSWDWSGTYSSTAFHDVITSSTTFISDGETHAMSENVTVDWAPTAFTMSGTATIDGADYNDFVSWKY